MQPQDPFRHRQHPYGQTVPSEQVSVDGKLGVGKLGVGKSGDGNDGDGKLGDGKDGDGKLGEGAT